MIAAKKYIEDLVERDQDPQACNVEREAEIEMTTEVRSSRGASIEKAMGDVWTHTRESQDERFGRWDSVRRLQVGVPGFNAAMPDTIATLLSSAKDQSAINFLSCSLLISEAVGDRFSTPGIPVFSRPAGEPSISVQAPTPRREPRSDLSSQGEAQRRSD